MLVKVIVYDVVSFSSIVFSLSIFVQKCESLYNWSRLTSNFTLVDFVDFVGF